MTVYGLLVSPKARKDLASIYSQIARDSEERARATGDAIVAQFERISEAPHRNVVLLQPRGLPLPVRSTPLKPYMVYFRVDEAHQTVQILRVRHGARRPLRRFD